MTTKLTPDLKHNPVQHQFYNATKSILSFLDFDECKFKTHKCHNDATCMNTNGSFNCHCNTGYTGNGTNCQGK